ncbi:MAG: Fe(2+)-trafficking protein [Gemmatimonadota bacterium]
MTTGGGGSEAGGGGFRCTRCERADGSPLGSPPFPDELGSRIGSEICADCWEAWKKQQMLLINHYGLNVRDANARAFLLSNLRAFLFGEGGASAQIDPSEEGTIHW